MSGFPGSGKDMWMARNRTDLPVVSLDDIRGERDVEPTDDQGTVVQLARERCREFLRAKTAFAFNATNILKQTRQRWSDLFAAGVSKHGGVSVAEGLSSVPWRAELPVYWFA